MAAAAAPVLPRGTSQAPAQLQPMSASLLPHLLASGAQGAAGEAAALAAASAAAAASTAGTAGATRPWPELPMRQMSLEAAAALLQLPSDGLPPPGGAQRQPRRAQQAATHRSAAGPAAKQAQQAQQAQQQLPGHARPLQGEPPAAKRARMGAATAAPVQPPGTFGSLPTAGLAYQQLPPAVWQGALLAAGLRQAPGQAAAPASAAAVHPLLASRLFSPGAAEAAAIEVRQQLGLGLPASPRVVAEPSQPPAAAATELQQQLLGLLQVLAPEPPAGQVAVQQVNGRGSLQALEPETPPGFLQAAAASPTGAPKPPTPPAVGAAAAAAAAAATSPPAEAGAASPAGRPAATSPEQRLRAFEHAVGVTIHMLQGLQQDLLKQAAASASQTRAIDQLCEWAQKVRGCLKQMQAEWRELVRVMQGAVGEAAQQLQQHGAALGLLLSHQVQQLAAAQPAQQAQQAAPGGAAGAQQGTAALQQLADENGGLRQRLAQLEAAQSEQAAEAQRLRAQLEEERRQRRQLEAALAALQAQVQRLAAAQAAEAAPAEAAGGVPEAGAADGVAVDGVAPPEAKAEAAPAAAQAAAPPAG